MLVEFVSANPTGPLTVGHGRNAVLGDAIARLFEATGHKVTREYYFNNAGRQMKLLGESVRARYLEQSATPLCSRRRDTGASTFVTSPLRWSANAAGLREEPATGKFKEAAERAIFSDIEVP